MTKRLKKSETFSKGCLVQVAALPLPFVGALAGPVGSAIGAVTMLILVFAGAKMSTKWYCGNCHNTIAGKHVHVCPNCKAAFD